jgi:dihydroceramidase
MYGPGSRGLFRPSWDFMSVSLLVLGFGSFLFHATLRQVLEFVDEFSMLGLTWSMLQATLTVRQPPSRARLITIGLAIVHLAFAVFYIWSAKIIYQVFAFTGALFILICKSQHTFHFAQPALPEAKRKDLNWRSWKGIGICLAGYLLWSIDLEYCAELRALRQQVGLPWAWLFEFHGWWHILTAIGASQCMQVAREAREEMRKEKKLQ